MAIFNNYRFKYEEIIKYLKNNNLSKSAFCNLCKISMHTLNELLKGNAHINAFTCYRVSEVLNISLIDLVIGID